MARPLKPRVRVNPVISDTARTAKPQEVRDLRVGVPEMTPALALVYAKLLSAGCPEERAVQYVHPLIEPERIRETMLLWKTSKHVIDALSGLNGGSWFDLTPEQRLKLAYENSNSQMAFHLWDTNFAHIGNKDDLEKLKMARVVVKELLGLQPDELDPIQAFSRFMHDMARAQAAAGAAKKKVPAQVQGDAFTEIVNKIPKTGLM